MKLRRKIPCSRPGEASPPIPRPKCLNLGWEGDGRDGSSRGRRSGWRWKKRGERRARCTTYMPLAGAVCSATDHRGCCRDHDSHGGWDVASHALARQFLPTTSGDMVRSKGLDLKIDAR